MLAAMVAVPKEMIEAAKNMEFIEAARLRDEILKMEEELKNKDE